MKTKIKDFLRGLLWRSQTSHPPQIRDVFRGSGFTIAPDKAYSRYPKPLPADPETEAYIIRFLVSEDDRDTLMQLLAGLSYEVLPELPTQVVRRSADETGRKLMLFLHPSFSGMVVSIASDDLDVLDLLQTTKLYPPLPGDSFPWIDPEVMGALQGDIEYWWDQFWLPFWGSLSQDEQSALDLEPEWREFIDSHQPVQAMTR